MRWVWSLQGAAGDRERNREHGDRPVFAFAPSFEFHVHQKHAAAATGCQACKAALNHSAAQPDLGHLAFGRVALDPVTGGETKMTTHGRLCLLWHHDAFSVFLFLLKRTNGDKEESQSERQQPDPYLFRGQCECRGREAASNQFHFSVNPQIMWTQFSSSCVRFWLGCLGSVTERSRSDDVVMKRNKSWTLY